MENETDPPPIRPGSWVRTARRCRRLSQRELAARSGVPASTVARIESGANCPRLDTFAKLMAATGFKLAVVDGKHEPMYVDEEREELRDCADRHFPAHLDVFPTPRYFDWHNPRSWWGWHRIAWPGVDSPVPAYTYWRRHKIGSGQWGFLTEASELARRWQDAT